MTGARCKPVRKWRIKMTKEYREGYCGSCENFAQLHDFNGQLICSECMQEKGEEPNEDQVFQ